jgi:hypothetical protein
MNFDETKRLVEFAARLDTTPLRLLRAVARLHDQPNPENEVLAQLRKAGATPLRSSHPDSALILTAVANYAKVDIGTAVSAIWPEPHKVIL